MASVVQTRNYREPAISCHSLPRKHVFKDTLKSFQLSIGENLLSVLRRRKTPCSEVLFKTLNCLERLN